MRRLRRSGGVVLVSFTLLAAVTAAGCGGPSVPDPAGPQNTPGSTPTAQIPSAATAGDGSSAGPAVDGTARLTAAFKAMATGYHFDTRVTIAGQEVTHAAGHWAGGRSEFVVESRGTSLTYRSIPPRSWIHQGGTGWVELADAAPSGDPLEPLRHPSKVILASEGADATVLQATYPPASLGAGGSIPVVVQVSVGPDGRTTATYTVVTTGGPVTTVTVLVAGQGDPITVPPAD